MNIDRIIVVTRETRLEKNIKRFNTLSQTKFYMKKRGQSFEDYQLEYDNYQYALDLVFKSLPKEIKFQKVERKFLANFMFTPKDLVITLGQDGLVVNVAKYLEGQPIFAVNPDPERFDGILLPFLTKDLEHLGSKLERGDFTSLQVSMAEVELNDGQRLLAFNDFFIGAKSHISARYTLSFGERSERQSSSGILVATPAGSTGWLSSVYNMTEGFAAFEGRQVELNATPPPWHAEELTFVVREPFRSKWSGADLVAGKIAAGQNIEVESHMAEKGVIFSDGMENDFLEFNSGATARISLAKRKTNLLHSKAEKAS